MPFQKDRDSIGLPFREFMYTVDQICYLLEVKEDYLKQFVLFYSRREPGIPPRNKIMAINIAPEGETPEWRIPETAFIRYLKHHGIKFYTRGYVSSSI